MIDVATLMDEIETLPLEIRTALVEKLLESINPPQKSIDASWAVESEKRVKEIQEKKAVCINGEDVFTEIKSRYGK